MLDEKQSLITTVYGIVKKHEVSFFVPGKEIRIENRNNIVIDILSVCDGNKTVKEVISITSKRHKKKDIKLFIEAFIEKRILINIHEYYELFHCLSVNPPIYIHERTSEDLLKMIQIESPLARANDFEKTKFEELLEVRESIREFSGSSMSRENIERLGWATYGIQKRSTSYPESIIGLGTIPSGGALYPLSLYVIVRIKGESINKGIYKFGKDGLEIIKKVNEKTLNEIFGLYSNPYRSAAVILILTANFMQVTQKYSNRGYRYALIEAGHAAQNTYLWCAENNFGVVEVCGFNDVKLAKALKINFPKNAPLTTLFVGEKIEKNY